LVALSYGKIVKYPVTIGPTFPECDPALADDGFVDRQCCRWFSGGARNICGGWLYVFWSYY
jgi:hypothetical protein